VVQLATVTGVLEDRPTNVWHFNAIDDAATADLIKTALTNFYTTIQSSLSPSLAQAGHSMKFYRLADPSPRAPYVDTNWGFPVAMSGAPMPSEVAVCMSFQATRASGQSQARRRGRLYLGPLRTGILGTDGRPATANVTTIFNAASTLGAASRASAAWEWSIFSPTSGLMLPVDNGWIDNAFDTQRRRGLTPTSRTTFVLPPLP